MVIAELAT